MLTAERQCKDSVKPIEVGWYGTVARLEFYSYQWKDIWLWDILACSSRGRRSAFDCGKKSCESRERSSSNHPWCMCRTPTKNSNYRSTVELTWRTNITQWGRPSLVLLLRLKMGNRLWSLKHTVFWIKWDAHIHIISPSTVYWFQIPNRIEYPRIPAGLHVEIKGLGIHESTVHSPQSGVRCPLSAVESTQVHSQSPTLTAPEQTNLELSFCLVLTVYWDPNSATYTQ